MKTLYNILAIAVLASVSLVVSAQSYPDEYLGLPGDNLNLYAVMNLFQESETLEGFEKSLNDSENMINNLDLNGDNYIDYITVSDYVDGNVHTIVLRAALSQNEQQDVAVFVVEQLRNGTVQIQLIGDEALYGPNYIVEPIYAETPNPGYTGKIYRSNVNVVTTTYYDIAAWPLIRFIYHPGYVVWRSSWYWGYYPRYWRPWRPHYWHYYYGYHYHWHDHYYSHYRHWDRYRCRHYTTFYKSHVHVYSPTVAVNINTDRYRSTYSRPDSRRAGEEYYTRTASQRSRSVVAANQRNTNAVRATSATRTGSRNNVPAVQRSNRAKSTPAVQRSSSGNSRSSTVQRSQPSRSSAVQRSSGSNSRKSSGSVSRSSSQRSAPAVQRSSSSSSSRSSTVQRSQPSRSSAVQRSSGSSSRKSSASVSRSSSAGKKSTGSERSSRSSRR